MNLTIGDKAPDFSAKDQNGNNVKLSDFKGKKVVLYFYPKDDTPGCTKEACGFRDDISAFREKEMVVIGVSLDDERSHEKFTKKYSLPLTLLADTTAEVSKKYGVYGPKMTGMGITRTTFVIGKSGIIEKKYDKVNCDTHSKDILNEMG